MKVIEIGMLSRTHDDDDRLPEYGIVIEANRCELKNIALNVLYNDVRVEPIENGRG